ncbi:AAA family ATPase [Chengkuizengella axinellae]|uniref:AAA family ATPase n=1 Tax=Chengkuizengella axinellae TaxID=3064388 RepID=A0ABT9IYQ0_9BACL|nr:AAA family ATPase [Chengkuizengella sp. 2205SS18-9]MDP5274494.1 AAA family ATPase [Chengkuizengella sp. 2205SS18-9]
MKNEIRQAREAKEASKNKKGDMIAICSANGGIGRTVMSTNLAVALAKNDMRVCNIDGNFQFGDLCLSMDVRPTFTIKDTVEELDQMDEYTLANFLVSHSSGVKILASPERPEYAELVTTSVLEKVYKLLVNQFDYLIVDTEAGLQDLSLFFIEKSDEIFLLTTLDMVVMRNTKMMLETFDILGQKEKVRVLVNKSSVDSVIKTADVPGILETENIFHIPNQPQLVTQSMNVGVPFVSNHGKTDLAKAYFKIAEQLLSKREDVIVTEEKKPPSNSILQSIFQKGKAARSIF